MRMLRHPRRGAAAGRPLMLKAWAKLMVEGAYIYMSVRDLAPP